MTGGDTEPGGPPATGGKEALGRLVVDDALGELDEVIAARVEPASLTCVLHRGQDQAREGSDDRDDDQELDEGEGRAASRFRVVGFQSHFPR